jgi:UPF0271 protein
MVYISTMPTVLDSSALINSSLFDIREDYYTVRDVLDELKDLKSRSLAESAMYSGKLLIREPDEVSVKRVVDKAKEVGSYEKLSETDIRVLALALDLKADLMTDDFTLQNLAKHLNVGFMGVMRGEIKEKRTF